MLHFFHLRNISILVCGFLLLILSCSSGNNRIEDVDQYDVIELSSDDEAKSKVHFISPLDSCFEIDFFNEPIVHEGQDVIEGSDEVVEMITFLDEISEQEFYSISYSDYPDIIMDDYSEEELLELATDGFVEGLALNIVHDHKDLSTERVKGVQFKAENEELNIITQLYIVNGRLYQLGAFGVKAVIEDEKAQQFFTSFELHCK